MNTSSQQEVPFLIHKMEESETNYKCNLYDWKAKYIEKNYDKRSYN